jgi:hypothetical protein
LFDRLSAPVRNLLPAYGAGFNLHFSTIRQLAFNGQLTECHLKKTRMPSTSPLLIQVVPQLKPARCGVSDHAILLAGELERAHGIETAFAVVNSNEPCDLPYPRVYCAQSELPEACVTLSQGRPAALLVHLSGYGYSRDGAPAELAEALERVRADGRFRVAVFFHELFATGMPWRSAFWHSRRQQEAVSRIARDCDLLVTNIRRHAEWLEGLPAKRSPMPVQVLPVFSNVGEAATLMPMALRNPALAIFGLAGTRRQAYRQLPALEKMLNGLGVREILDIGPEFDTPREVGGIPVRRKGAMEAADLGKLLSQTRFGFANYSSPYLAKSGVIAGLCAFGTVPLTTKPFEGEVDGLRDGVQLISPRTVEAAARRGLESCSTAAWNWHAGHNLRVHASSHRDWLMGE